MAGTGLAVRETAQEQPQRNYGCLLAGCGGGGGLIGFGLFASRDAVREIHIFRCKATRNSQP
jgi:hypothetical protein